jgi:hypothetical protein
MGNTTPKVDWEIRALTQLVSSYIQKRSSLNYQINQLKLAQNTKKTCIETKKLRDLKAKNATLVIEIKNSEKLLAKIKQKKFIRPEDKDLSKYLSHFNIILAKKNNSHVCVSNELSDERKLLENKKKHRNERNEYLIHLKQKFASYSKDLSSNAQVIPKIQETVSEVLKLREKLATLQEKTKEVSAKHSAMLAKRRVKRRGTLVVPKLPPSAFVLRSKLIAKNDLIKHISELEGNLAVHQEQQNNLKLAIEQGDDEIDEEAESELEKLQSEKELLHQKISLYRSNVELYQKSPRTPFSTNKELSGEIIDSLNTDFDPSESESESASEG